MVKFLQRIWDDILHGENIDIYITVLISLFISVSSLLNLPYVKIETLPGITLGILALIAVSSLVGRFKVEDLSSKISPSINSIFVNEFPQNFRDDFSSANEVWLSGASLSNIISDHYSLFERKLKQGRFSIRILVMNPNNDNVLSLSEMRAYANPSLPRAKAKLEALLSDACALKSVFPDQVQVRVVDFPVTHRLITIDPSAHTGKIYVSNYPFKTPGGSLPKFVVTAKDHHWFEHYKLEHNNLWEAGKDFGCPGG